MDKSGFPLVLGRGKLIDKESGVSFYRARAKYRIFFNRVKMVDIGEFLSLSVFWERKISRLASCLKNNIF